MKYVRRQQTVEAIRAPGQDGWGFGADPAHFAAWLGKHGADKWFYNARAEQGSIDGTPFSGADWIVRIDEDMAGMVGPGAKRVRFTVLDGGQFRELYEECR